MQPTATGKIYYPSYGIQYPVLVPPFLLLSLLFLSRFHMEELDSVQKFIEVQGWLLLTFFICLHNQLSSFNSIIVQMSEKHDSSSGQ